MYITDLILYLTLLQSFPIPAQIVLPSQDFMSCFSTTASKISQLGPKGRQFVIAGDAESAWLQLDELGQQLMVTTSPATQIVKISQPLRFGVIWIHVSSNMRVKVESAEAGLAKAGFQATLHCEKSTELAARLDWLNNLASLDAQLNSSPDREQVRQTLQAIDRLGRLSSYAASAALISHYRALGLFVEGKFGASKAEFSSAASAWEIMASPERALAAHVGEVEAEYNENNMLKVLKDTEDLSAEMTIEPYFAARLQGERCLALESVGEIVKADSCYRSNIATLRQLKELPESASVLENYANFQRKLGKFILAQQYANEAFGLASGPYASRTRGRIHLLLATIDRQRGSIATAIQHTEVAYREFNDAGSDASQWRARARIEEAILLEHVGALYEAYSVLGDISTLLSTHDAQFQLALSARIFSDLESDTHHPESALLWARVAEDIYTQLGLLPARDIARLERLKLQLDMGDYVEVERGVAEKHADLPLYDAQWKLLDARLAIKEGLLPHARSALDVVRHKPLSLRDQLRYAQTEAEYQDHLGDTAGAQHTLLDAASRVDQLSRRTNSAILRYVIARHALALRRAAFGLVLHRQRAETSDAVAAIWPWIALSAYDVHSEADNKETRNGVELFDRAVAAELLATSLRTKSNSDSLSKNEILSLMAEPSELIDDERQNNYSFATVAAMQERLDDNTAYIAYLDGETRGALLWVTHDEATLLDAGTPDDIRTAASLVRLALSSPSKSINEIQPAVQALSSKLLGRMPRRFPPKHLLVQSDEVLSGMAWSTLIWPGQTEPLVDTTIIEQVRLDRNPANESTGYAAPINVVIASQQQFGGTQLPSLAAASTEPQLIRNVSGGHTLTTTEGGDATREAVLSALDQAGAWVHIAAHGAAQPQRLGYAGLWLEPSEGKKIPTFLSWLDILDTGVRANLVVLNACQLGDGGDAVNGNLSFAAAVSRAGAQQVVASLWPVSDSASALWVPAFYSALQDDPKHNAAQALRAAQLRLRSTRAFAHPFFWAGMQALSRYSVR